MGVDNTSQRSSPSDITTHLSTFLSSLLVRQETKGGVMDGNNASSSDSAQTVIEVEIHAEHDTDISQAPRGLSNETLAALKETSQVQYPPPQVKGRAATRPR